MKNSIILLLSVLVSIVLGIVAVLASIVGGALLENTPMETLGGCIAVVLYCLACQFWLSRRSGGGFRASWPTLVGMVASLLVACLLWVKGGLFHNWPLFLSGCTGSLAGVLLTVRRRTTA